MLGESESADLIASIYDAALDAALWPTVIAGIASATKASAACFAVRDADGRFEIQPIGFDARAARSYTEHFAHIDTVLPAVTAGTPGVAVDGDSILSRAELSRAELERSDVYVDWAAPNGLHELAAVLVERSSALTVTLAVNRSRRGDAFGRDELQLLERVTPHLRRAFRIQQRLAASWANDPALDRLRDGVVLVDREARVLFANPAAEALLRANDGLRTEQRALATPRRAETAALRALIAGDGGTLAIARIGQAPLGLVIVPMRSEASWLIRERPAALVFIADGAAEPVSLAERLRAIFGLTAAQAALAREIARGDGLDAAAERLGITRATARTHLANVFAKTGTRRQAELVRLLLRVSPNLLDP
jgi:DNA-binding CsgD family transcriptional regulator/PAS domain-containing protein